MSEARILRKPPLWMALCLCLVLASLVGWLRLGVFGRTSVPIGFGVPIVIVGWTRRRWLVWIMVAIFVVMTEVKMLVINVPPSNDYTPMQRGGRLTMLMADMLVVAYIVDLVLRRRAELEARGHELAQRNEEIVLQNDELNNQAEELEQQSEELRVANEELEARQHTSEAMLELSRSISPDMSRQAIFVTIAQAMQRLIPAVSAAVVWERSGEELRLVYHHGFGDAGSDTTRISREHAFANLVLERDRTGYLENVALRADLCLAQPKVGARFKAVMSTPMHFRDEPQKVLEIYSAQEHVWSAQEIIVLEKMCAQAVASMVASDLYGEVDQEHRRLQTILDTVPFGISTLNAAASKININAAGAAMMGVPRELEGEQFGWPKVGKILREGKEIKHEDYILMRALRGETIGSTELELKFHDGRTVFILACAAPIRDRWGNIIAAVAAFADITSQKAIQQELEQRRQQAEENSAKKSRFLGAASHDIRTPANAIGLIAELIRRSAADPALANEIPELALELQNSSASLVNLISDVLDVTRLDIGRIELHETEFDLCQWMNEECQQLRPLAEEKKLKFECRTPQKAVQIRADRVKLARVLVNLIGNAIKFTDAGEVIIESRVIDDGFVQLSVSDTGVGIATENQSKIFDEFLQLKNAGHDRVKGSGLGLSICKRLVERMGGQLELVSALGQGSTFSFTVPLAGVAV